MTHCPDWSLMACQLASSAQRTLSRLPGDIALALATPPNRPPPPWPLTCSPEDFPGPAAVALATLRVGRLLAKALLSAGSRGGRPEGGGGGRQGSGVTGTKAPPQCDPQDCTPLSSGPLASAAPLALCLLQSGKTVLPPPPSLSHEVWVTPWAHAPTALPSPSPSPLPAHLQAPHLSSWATSPLPVVAMGAGAGGWLGAVGVPDGACPLTSTEAVGLARGPRLAEVCGAAGAPPALFWRMIPDGT